MASQPKPRSRGADPEAPEQDHTRYSKSSLADSKAEAGVLVSPPATEQQTPTVSWLCSDPRNRHSSQWRGTRTPPAPAKYYCGVETLIQLRRLASSADWRERHPGWVRASVCSPFCYGHEKKKKKKTLPLNGPLRIGPEIWSMKIPPASKL